MESKLFREEDRIQLLNISEMVRLLLEKHVSFKEFKEATLLEILQGVDFSRAVLDPDAVRDFHSSAKDLGEMIQRQIQQQFVNAVVGNARKQVAFEKAEKQNNELQMLSAIVSQNEEH